MVWFGRKINFVPHYHIVYGDLLPRSVILVDSPVLLSIKKHSIFGKKCMSVWNEMKHPWASCQIRTIAGCACTGNAGNVFPHYRGLAIPTCITARAWRTCRDACRELAVSFEVGSGENVPGIPGARATRDFTYLVRGPCVLQIKHGHLWFWSSVNNCYLNMPVIH